MLVCAGSGGVGKTTMAAAFGVRAAHLGLRVLVLTVDPAMRLATTLGLDLKSGEFQEVNGLKAKGSLHAGVVQSHQVFDEFIAHYSKNPEQVERLINNRLYQQLSTTLSGSQEFTSLEKLLQAYESERFDLIILDTPPTKHALDFLKAPQRIAALFSDSVARWFMDPEVFQGGGLFTRILHRGTMTVFKGLEVLTGAEFIRNLTDFFENIRASQGQLRDRSRAVENLLKSEQTRFILVTSFDEAKFVEARKFRGQLLELGYHLDAVVVNRAFPLWMRDDQPLVSSGEKDRSLAALETFYGEFRRYYSGRYQQFELLQKEMQGGTTGVWRVPDFNQDIHNLEGLGRVTGDLQET